MSAAGLQDIEDEFALLPDWEERFRYVVELGRELEPLTDAERTDINKVRGCASQVWLVAERDPADPSRFHFRGDSDALLVRGLIAVLLRLYNGATAQEILAVDARAEFERLGFGDSLTPQRSNGFFSMVGRIRREAEAAQAQR